MTQAAASAQGTELKATITIDATPAQVWALVTDVARMSSWSPQVVRTVVLGGPVRLGSTFVNLNRNGVRFWPTTAKVVRFDPHEEFAFRNPANWTIWSYHLEPVAGGTLVTERRETPKGISPPVRLATAVLMGGEKAFTAVNLEGMVETLERMKAELEA